MKKLNNNLNSISNNQWLLKVDKYKEINWKKSTWQLLNSFIPFFVLWYVSYKLIPINYALSLLISLLNAGFVARIFIFLHDCCHGTFFKSRFIRNTVGFICGVVTLTPFIHWQKVHLIHHACSSNLDRRDIGDFPLMTVEEFLKSDEKAQKNYRLMRHPLMLFLVVPFVLFFILQRFPVKNVGAFNKRDLDSVRQTNLSILAIIVIMSYFVGFKNFLLVQIPISLFVSTIGVFMFFVQHQFENTYWSKKEDLSYYDAAMKGSSFFKLPSVLNWFTGNVGYHHIHHLAPSIPNYNLVQCYKENPEFQKTIPLTLKDSIVASKFKLWDGEKGKLVTFSDIRHYS
jgi:omega-6 fatty acid desaturase (delta-12 desaturase)